MYHRQETLLILAEVINLVDTLAKADNAKKGVNYNDGTPEHNSFHEILGVDTGKARVHNNENENEDNEYNNYDNNNYENDNNNYNNYNNYENYEIATWNRKLWGHKRWSW